MKVSPRLLLITLVPYYIFTILNSALQGVGMILLVNIFTNGLGKAEDNPLVYSIEKMISFFGGKSQLPEVIPFIIVLFVLSLFVRFALLTFDGYLVAWIRRRLQETVFFGYLRADWSHMRNFRVGEANGTTTNEAAVVAKYLTAASAAIYYMLSASVVLGMALYASFKITIVLGAVSLPIMILMKTTFKIQSRLSLQAANLRNKFSSDVTDRLNGLLQIHLDNNLKYHFQRGIEAQAPLNKLEITIGYCQAIIGSFNIIQPLLALIAFFFWLKFTNNAPLDFALIASVGMLGVKVVSQLNGATSAYGNLSRLSGSLHPVLDALNLPPTPKRELISEKVIKVNLKNAHYSFGDQHVLQNITLDVEQGSPLVLSGRSGKGKTTLANLIAGLYFPSKGNVEYVGSSAKVYPSPTHYARVGFVTQDIYLFHGNLRHNLTAGRDRTDDQIWTALRKVDAADFVEKLGGLDVTSAEAGRSLSGGQRRRLGIARVLLSGSDILIFDEITSGLDNLNIVAVLKVVEELCQEYIVIMISHDESSLPGQKNFTI